MFMACVCLSGENLFMLWLNYFKQLKIKAEEEKKKKKNCQKQGFLLDIIMNILIFINIIVVKYS